MRERLPPFFTVSCDKFMKRWRVGSVELKINQKSRAWLLWGKKGAADKLVGWAWATYRHRFGDDLGTAGV